MIWILSFFLCALLTLATLMIMFPQLLLPLVERHWQISSQHRNY
jgi:hypothetical protein